AAALAMAAVFWLFSMPGELSWTAGPVTAEPLKTSLILAGVSIACSLAAGLFDRLESRQGSSPVLPYPLIAAAALSAILAGGNLRPAPAAQKPPAEPKTRAEVILSQGLRALQAPFQDYPGRFMGSNGPLPVGVLLTVLGSWLLARPRRTPLEEPFPDEPGDER
ncbi:MAG: hypothetical protein WCI75_20590, partial [candidate division NC10 bacterium]